MFIYDSVLDVWGRLLMPTPYLRYSSSAWARRDLRSGLGGMTAWMNAPAKYLLTRRILRTNGSFLSSSTCLTRPFLSACSWNTLDTPAFSVPSLVMESRAWRMNSPLGAKRDGT